MKIAFYLENQGIPDVDLSRPALGNPGCGNTEYRFAALPAYLAASGVHDHEFVIIANHVERLPNNVRHVEAADVVQAALCAKNEGCGLLVWRPRRYPHEGFLALIDHLRLPLVAWPGITPVQSYLRALARSPYVKAFVCVGQEQHDLVWDSPIWSKLTCIPNGLDMDGFRLVDPPAKEPNLVAYLGALVPQKGFHLLAEAWPHVLQRHPTARLAVIGSGALYDKAAALGPWGVAAPEYEARFAAYLAGPDGRLHSSVSFLGKLSQEKKEWLYRSTVGVPNPSGHTETFCMSAVEFQACGTAVVSAAEYGLLDAVRHGRTGLLGSTRKDLVENICELLAHPARAKELGRNGSEFVRERYDYSVVTAEWHDLFGRLARGARPRGCFLKLNLHRHGKVLILVNRLFQMILGRVVDWPSVIGIKTRVARMPLIRALIASRAW